MSYSPLGALHGHGIAAHAPDTCSGGETSTPVGATCCNWRTWDNATYNRLIGSHSYRRVNERRVRRILDQLLNTSLKHGTGSYDGENGLERILYDSTTQVLQNTGKEPELAPGFIDGLWRATNVFVSVFPWGRWKYNKECRRTDCQGDGYYGCWRLRGATLDKAKIDLLATVVPLTSLDRKRLAEGKVLRLDLYNQGFLFGSKGKTQSWSPALSAWLVKAEAVIKAVPGGGPDGGVEDWNNICLDIECYPRTRRNPHYPDQGLYDEKRSNQNKTWLQWNGNILGPKAWLQSFIALFAARPILRLQLISKIPALLTVQKTHQPLLAAVKPSMIMQSVPKRAIARGTSATPPAGDEGKEKKKEEQPEQDEDVGFPIWGWLAIGAGVLGVGYFVMRDKGAAK